MSHNNQLTVGNHSPFYFPLENGRYEVKPGLYKFPHDFGNGDMDLNIFQIDREYPLYRQEKLAARRERLEKYYCTKNFGNGLAGIINEFIIQILVREYPQYFRLAKNRQQTRLDCRLSGETLLFDKRFHLQESISAPTVSPGYIDGFDALACQIQEDLSVIRLTAQESDNVIALHLCLPNHWAAEDKIGRGFADVHHPVPDMHTMNKTASQIVQAMIHKGPFIRFAWGVATDKRLNHHPLAAENKELQHWHGRHFNPENPQLYLRIERQTSHGLPDYGLALFTIRTYFLDIHDLKSNAAYLEKIISALRSMNDSIRDYKGIKRDFPAIIQWLSKIKSGAM